MLCSNVPGSQEGLSNTILIIAVPDQFPVYLEQESHYRTTAQLSCSTHKCPATLSLLDHTIHPPVYWLWELGKKEIPFTHWNQLSRLFLFHRPHRTGPGSWEGLRNEALNSHQFWARQGSASQTAPQYCAVINSSLMKVRIFTYCLYFSMSTSYYSLQHLRNTCWAN